MNSQKHSQFPVFRARIKGAAARFRTSGLLSILALALLGGGSAPLAGAEEPLSSLAKKPNWSDLQPYQNTITRDDFLRLLTTLYAPGGDWRAAIQIKPDEAIIHQPGKNDIDFRLRFARSAQVAKPAPRYWAAPGERKTPASQPLAGYTIALDPGHLGGKWAKMEERWFQIGDASKPVMEGEMALATARLLAARLKAFGANVVYVRNASEPVTRLRPGDLRSAARAELSRQGVKNPRDDYNGPNDPEKNRSVRWESELLFYRVSEIRTRGELVNNRLKPDLTICLHYNAEDWGNPAHPTLTDKDHMHLLVNGSYAASELYNADERHDMLMKLLSRTARVELPLSSRVAASLAQATGLPAFEYKNGRARKVTESAYVWSRNLLATRLYDCPVVYCEPYVMNSQWVFDRVQLGDYEGTKSVGGSLRKSLYREYADAVANGVANYFASKRPKGN